MAELLLHTSHNLSAPLWRLFQLASPASRQHILTALSEELSAKEWDQWGALLAERQRLFGSGSEPGAIGMWHKDSSKATQQR